MVTSIKVGSRGQSAHLIRVVQPHIRHKVALHAGWLLLQRPLMFLSSSLCLTGPTTMLVGRGWTLSYALHCNAASCVAPELRSLKRRATVPCPTVMRLRWQPQDGNCCGHSCAQRGKGDWAPSNDKKKVRQGSTYGFGSTCKREEASEVELHWCSTKATCPALSCVICLGATAAPPAAGSLQIEELPPSFEPDDGHAECCCTTIGGEAES